jgi:hypothetical protein
MMRRRFYGAWLLGMAALAALSATPLPVEAQQRGPRVNPNRSGSTPVARPLFVAGTITAVSSTGGTLSVTPTQSANSTAVNLMVTANTTISIDGVTGKGLANLAVGMRAGVAYQTTGGVNNAIQINASDRYHVSGTITALASDGSTLSITASQPANSQAVTLNVTSSTGISLDGVTGKSVTNLVVGMRAKAGYQLTSSGNNATQVDASDIFHVSGTITALASDGSKLRITPDSATTAIKLAITSSTVIRVDNVKGQTAANLVVGMRAKATYQLTSTGNNATQIDASDKLHVDGTIAAVTLSTTSTTTGTVTVTPVNGSAVTLNINLGNGNGTTTVKLDDTAVTSLATLLPGMRVKAHYQLTSTGNNATRIDASDQFRVHGTITALTPLAGSTTAGTLTVTPNNSSAVTLNVDVGNGTTVSVSGATVTTLNSLATGMRVEARYQLTSFGNNASLVKAWNSKQ